MTTQQTARARLTQRARRRTRAHMKRKQGSIRRRYERAEASGDAARAAALASIGTHYTYALVRHLGSSKPGHSWAYAQRA